MEHPEITFNEDGDFVSIWIGSFGTEAAAEAYVEPHYGEEHEDEPLSEFASDIGLKHYDDDHRELQFEPGLSSKGEAALSRHSYGETFAATAWEAIERLSLGEFDTVLMLYGYNHAARPQASRVPVRVRFVGTFSYVIQHPEWFEQILRGEEAQPPDR